LDTIINQKLLYGWNEESGTTLILSIRPDPQKLMSEHNLFDIQENGTHQIEIEICDIDGICASCKQNVFLGPIVGIDKKQKYYHEDKQILLNGVYIGNLGLPHRSKMYFALLNPLTNDFWTYKNKYGNINLEPESTVWYKNNLVSIGEVEIPVIYNYIQNSVVVFDIQKTGMTDSEVLTSYFLIGLDLEDDNYSLDWNEIEDAPVL